MNKTPPTTEQEQKKQEIYLREVETINGQVLDTTLDIFKGNIKEDRKYWKKYQNGTARYFELKEVTQ